MSDIAHDVGRFVEQGVLPRIVVLLLVAGVLASPVARLLGIARVAGFAVLATTLPILAITRLVPPWHMSLSSDVWLWWTRDWARVPGEAFTGSQWWLNVLLFVPAGAVLAAVFRRPGRVAAALAASSFAIETMQALFDTGSPDPVDLLANSLGGAIGAAAGAAVAMQHLDRVAARRLGIALGAVAFLGVPAGFFAARAYAGSRLHDQVIHLRQRFDRFTRADLQRYMDDGNIVFFLAEGEPFPDGMQYPDDATLVVRYPMTTLGFDRCAYVTFTAVGADVRGASGDKCTRFIG